MLVLLADLSKLSTVDRDVDHYTMVGGASIYPFAWSILLAARTEGLAGVLTTMVVRDEAVGEGAARGAGHRLGGGCSGPRGIRYASPPGSDGGRSTASPPSTGSTVSRWRDS